MDDAKLEEKFTRLSGKILNPQVQQAVLSAIDRIDRNSPSRLLSIIGPKPASRITDIEMAEKMGGH